MKPGTWSRRLDDEAGMTIVELMAALFILGVGMLALAAAMGLGFKTVALGRQRQTATEVANARVEHLRNLSYTSVALSSQPVASTDPAHPSYSVSSDGTRFDHTGKTNCAPVTASCEPLIVDAAGGGVLHIEDPIVVGSTSVEVYQYVTWVDDPNVSGAENYRRLTVIVRYKAPAATGVSRVVRVSALFTTDTVTVGGTGATATDGTPASASPSATPTTTCGGDADAPTGSFSISSTGSETGYTASPTVTLRMTLSDSCTPIIARFSNDDVTYGSDVTYDPANATVSWTLSSGDGTKNIYARVRDAAGNQRTLGPVSVVLDATKPTVPGSVSRTVSCPGGGGNNRTVTFTWGASTDANLLGYRVYRSVNSGTWTAVATVSTTSYQETHDKTLDSLRLRVVGYDKAGNESDPSSEVSLAKNQCS